MVLLWEGCSYSVPEVIIRPTSVSGSHVQEYESFNRFSAGDNDVFGWASGRFGIFNLMDFSNGSLRHLLGPSRYC